MPPSSPAASSSISSGAPLPDLGRPSERSALIVRAHLPAGLGRPSERSALIVRAHLPAGLERLRRHSVGDAAAGVPAHLTLLYPFVAPDRLVASIRSRIDAVAAQHRPFDYILVGLAQWPDTVYVAVDPLRPFVALQADLSRAFPEFPIYGRNAGFEFVPHVTIAEGAGFDAPGTIADRAWRALPREGRARRLEVIVAGDDGRWRTAWRIPLGGRTGRRERGPSVELPP